MSAVERLNALLKHRQANDLPLDELLGLEAEALEACAAEHAEKGDHELAAAERVAAEHAWNAAETQRDHQRADGRAG